MKEIYRYDLAFLRCVAIVLVIGYHLKLPFFEAGFVGVDLFFVLSGYLMTQILWTSTQQKRFDFGKFYQRRMNRIFPVLFAVLLVFFLVVWLALGPKLYDYSRFAVSSALFISNFYYHLQSGYFQIGSELNFLLHTWSLSVEIQFYLIFPIVFWILNRLFKGRIKGLIGGLLGVAALSFLSLYSTASADESFRFFMLHTRLWEFLIGGVAFLLRKEVGSQLALPIRRGAAAACMTVVLCYAFLWPFEWRISWPNSHSVWLIIAAAGQLMLFPAGEGYRWKAVRFLADRSYGLYLWHWPLVVLAYYFGSFERWEVKFCIVVLSLLLSSISYALLEKNYRLYSTRLVFASCALVAAICFIGTRVPLFQRLLPEQEYQIFSFLYDYRRNQTAAQYGFQQTHLQYNEDPAIYNKKALQRFDDGERHYLLIGDCHAGMFSATLKQLAEKHQVHLSQATMDEAFPAPDVTAPFAGPDSLMRYLFEDYLPAHAQRFEKVILMANYAGYSKKDLANYLKSNAAYFSALNVPIVYIGQTEQYRIEYPVAEFLHQRYGISVTRFLRPIPAQANAFMKSSLRRDQYIEVFQCEGCTYWDQGQAYMYDQEHFSVAGTQQLSEKLERALF